MCTHALPATCFNATFKAHAAYVKLTLLSSTYDQRGCIECVGDPKVNLPVSKVDLPVPKVNLTVPTVERLSWNMCMYDTLAS